MVTGITMTFETAKESKPTSALTSELSSPTDRCAAASRCSSIQCLYLQFIKQHRLYHSHLQHPPYCLIWPPLLACHITMATGTQERHEGGGSESESTRRGGGVDSFANFALHFKVGNREDVFGKRTAFEIFFRRWDFWMNTCDMLTEATDVRDCIVLTWLMLINHLAYHLSLWGDAFILSDSLT